MPAMFLKSAHTFRFGRQRGVRSTSDADKLLQAQVNQLQAKLKQAEFNFAQSEMEKAVLLKELAQVRVELAQSRLVDALASAPSPSDMRH